jgi:Fic family protein
VDGWPAHTWLVEPWRTNPDARDSGGRRPPREDRLLTEVSVAVPPRIASLTPNLSAATTAAIEDASAAAARVDEEAATALGALSGFLLRSESVATSKIERVNATTDDVARAIAGAKAGSAAREVVGAIRAITAFVDSASHGSVTRASILEAHEALLGDNPQERHEAGRFRTVQNWLGGSDFSPRDAVYVPPPPRMVDDLIADLLEFANRDDLSAIAQAALAHAQFESIHPFSDGNGRIGRALVNAVLRSRRLTRRTVVPIASALLADVDGYFEALTNYRSGDADEFVRRFADATSLAAEEAHACAAELQSLPAAWRERFSPRRGSAASKLLDRLLDVPVLSEKSATEITRATPSSLYAALDRLTDAEILTEITGQRRNRVWVAHDVLDEIDRLEERIGRRRRPTKLG